MISRFFLRTASALLAVAALAAAGCGSTAHKGSDSSAPRGQLTAAEFRALHQAMVAGKRIFNDHLPLARQASRGGMVCAPLAEVQTDLMVSEASDCGRLVALIQELVGSVGEARACPGDPGCVAGILQSGARSATSVVVAGRGTVEAVRARGFAGRCAALLRPSHAELAKFTRLSDAFTAARAALLAHDRARFEAADRQMKRAAAALKSTGDTDPAELGRRCRHE